MVAAGAGVGGGHLSRSMALAEKFVESKGVAPVFCAEGLNGTWEAELSKANIDSIPWTKLESVFPCAGGVVDGYNFSDQQYSVMRQNVDLLAKFCDHGQPETDLDVVISLSSEVALAHGQTLLSGLMYAPVRKSFHAEYALPVRFPAQHIVVTCGWHDSSNRTLRVIKALENSDFRGFATVLIGDDAPHLRSLQNYITRSRRETEIKLITGETDTSEWLKTADLVIGLGGVSLLERLALGRPSLTIGGIPNQKYQIDTLVEAGATTLLEPQVLEDPGLAAERINTLLCDEEQLFRFANQGSQAVDGRGAKRLAQALIQKSQE